MAEPDNLVLTLLREMRSATDDRFDAVDARLDAMQDRFNGQDQALESIRQAPKSETILGRYVVNGVDDCFDKIESVSTPSKAEAESAL